MDDKNKKESLLENTNNLKENIMEYFYPCFYKASIF